MVKISGKLGIFVLALLLITLPLVAGCGGGDGTEEPATPTDVASPSPTGEPTPTDEPPPPPDADGDGISDAEDNCPDVANADQADADDDNIGDECDACPNDQANDYDKDGICSPEDNCGAVANEDQADADNDGAGDACDDCPNDADDDADGDGICGDEDACPNDPDNDVDGDGVCGDVDNCPNHANADQDPSVCADDWDSDGVPNAEDNCPNTPNPDQADADADGIGDACDAPEALGTSWVYDVSYSNDPKVDDNTTTWTYTVNSADADTYTADATVEGTPQVGFFFPDMGTSFKVQEDASSITRSMSNMGAIVEALTLSVKSVGMVIVGTKDFTYDGDVPGAPFTVGDTWSYSLPVTTDVGVTLNFAYDAEVVGTEEVTVPAGTFECYKIVHTESKGKTNTGWWAVEGDYLTPIKFVDGSFFDGTQTFELASYTPAE